LTVVTVTVKLPLEVNHAALVAAQFTVVVPTGNALPEAGAHDTTGFRSTSSAAVAVQLTTAPGCVVMPPALVAAPAVSSGLSTRRLERNQARITL